MDEYESFKNENPISPSDITLQLIKDDYAIICNKATVGWQSRLPRQLTMVDDRMLLENVSFTAKAGQVLAIVGQVGSGKVSFLIISIMLSFLER